MLPSNIDPKIIRPHEISIIYQFIKLLSFTGFRRHSGKIVLLFTQKCDHLAFPLPAIDHEVGRPFPGGFRHASGADQ